MGLPYLYEIVKHAYWRVESANELSEEDVERHLERYRALREKIESDPSCAFPIKTKILYRVLLNEDR